jgi:5-methylcytosine-specific restriction endonuclease McrA
MDLDDAETALEEKRRKDREKSARWRAKNPEKVKASRDIPAQVEKLRQRCANDPEYRKKRQGIVKASKLKHAEKRKVYDRAYQARTKEQAAERSRRSYEKNKEDVARRAAERHEKNPSKRKAQYVAYVAANPEKIRARSANRTAQKKSAKGRITKDDIRKLFVEQFSACLYCKADLQQGYHLDHRTPLCRGGAHALYNLQLLCIPCNLKKNGRDPAEYEASIGFSRA